jgi:hypothetical protein
LVQAYGKRPQPTAVLFLLFNYKKTRDAEVAATSLTRVPDDPANLPNLFETFS